MIIKHKLRTFCISFGILIFLTILVIKMIDASNAIQQREAMNIATERLADFAKKRSLSVSDFGKAEVRWNDSMDMWEMYYEGIGSNNLLVAISVEKTGGSEVHFTMK